MEEEQTMTDLRRATWQVLCLIGRWVSLFI